MLDFGFRDADLPKKLQGRTIDPWIFRGRAPRVTVIVDRFLRDWERKHFLNFLKQKNPIDHYEVLYGLKAEPETLKSGIHWFLGSHRINLETHLTPGRPVITFGNALTIITRDGDVDYEAFLDKAWNKTYLDYHPMKLRVYPCFPLADLVSADGKILDAFPNHHFLEQEHRAFTTKYENRRLVPCKTVVVENPNEFLEARMGPGSVAWDLETGGFDFVDDKIGCLTVSFDGITGYYLRWKDVDINTLSRFFEGKFQVGANCLEGNMKVLLADGSWEKISTLVNKKKQVSVMSVSPSGKLEPKPIVNWFKNGKLEPDKKWLDLRFDYKGNRNGNSRLRCTPQHMVFTEKGETPAGLVRPGDKVRFFEGANPDLKQFIYASFLGDGCFAPSQTTFAHAEGQLNYLSWKRDYLLANGIRCSKVELDRVNNGVPFYRFRARASYKIRGALKGKSRLDVINALDLKGLLLWYLDDGSLDRSSLSLHCASFSDEEFEAMERKLQSLLGEEASGIARRKASGFQTETGANLNFRLRSDATEALLRLFETVRPAPLVPYKLLPEGDFHSWSTETFTELVTVTGVTWVAPKENKSNGSIGRFKYDLEVEGNHNYIAEGLQVHNCKFDVKFLRKLGVKNLVIGFDTMQCGHILNEIRSNSLKTHAWIYTTIGGYDWDLENWKRNNPRVKSYLDIPESVIAPYAALDAVATFQAYKAMRKHLAEDPLLEKYFDTFIMPALNMFCDIEYEGVDIDWSALDRLKVMLEPKIEEIRQRCFKALGVDWIDLDSGKVMGLHYEKMGLIDLGRAKEKKNDEGETTSGGYYLSGKDVVGEWIKQGHTELMPILEYSKWTALRDTFCGNLTSQVGADEDEVLIDPSKWASLGDEDSPKKKKNKSPGYRKYRSSDGKIHSNFLVFFASSHRHRSSSPNLQNIAKKDEEIAKLVRAIFRTPNDEEFYIAEGDSAGFQLRIGAAQSGDANMRRAFLEVPGGDLHSVTGHSVFTPHITLEEFLAEKKGKYKKYRNRSKAINFGLIFGASAKVLVEQTLLVEWSDKDAEEFVAEKELDWRVSDLMEKGKSRRMANFTACAEFIREKFFELYPGLIDWHEENQAYAEINGYIRSPFGARRLLPWLTYTGTDSDGAETKNMKNIAVNSPVQNHEVIPMSTVMIKLHNLIKERNLKSRIIMTVHDSVVLAVHRSEIFLIAKTMLNAFAFDFPQNKGIGTMGEINFAAPWKGEVWGFGQHEISDDNINSICELLGETTPQVA